MPTSAEPRFAWHTVLKQAHLKGSFHPNLHHCDLLQTDVKPWTEPEHRLTHNGFQSRTSSDFQADTSAELNSRRNADRVADNNGGLVQTMRLELRQEADLHDWS